MPDTTADASRKEEPADAGARDRLPALQGVRVLDIGTMVAGPVAATLLGEFGAEVIKIEKPDGGDSTRNVGPYVEGQSLWWQVEGRNKKSLTLDLRKPEGQQVLRGLVERSDVLIENFRPGTLLRWGLGYDDLSRLNPGLVMCSVSGFGQTGPYSQRAGYDRIGQAFGGLMHITGYPDRPPIRPGTAMADYQSALFAALGVMLALYARDAGGAQGRGQHIDLALYESVFRFTDILAPAFDKLGIVRERQGNLHFAAAPGEHFEMADGRFLILTCSSDGVFRRICEALGQPGLAMDERFRTHDARWKRIAEINGIVAEWVRGNEPAHVTAALDRAGAPYTVALTIADIFADPQYAARQSIAEIVHATMGTLRMPAVVPKLSLTPGAIATPGPDLGQHTDTILQEVLDLSGEDISQLRANGIV